MVLNPGSSSLVSSVTTLYYVFAVRPNYCIESSDNTVSVPELLIQGLRYTCAFSQFQVLRSPASTLVLHSHPKSLFAREQSNTEQGTSTGRPGL